MTLLTKTISTLFMLRPLGLSSSILSKFGFINAFSKDIDKEYCYDEGVYLLFKPLDMDIFRSFLEQEYETTDVIEDYDYSGGYVVVVYKLKNEFKNDFTLVKLGLYSKTSKSFQDTFPKVVKIIDKKGRHKDEISLQYRIFNKTQDLIDFWEDTLNVTFSKSQEVWEGFHEEKETLNIQNIIYNVEKVSN